MLQIVYKGRHPGLCGCNNKNSYSYDARIVILVMQKQLLTKAKREMFKCSNIHWGLFATRRYARTLLYKGKYWQ